MPEWPNVEKAAANYLAARTGLPVYAETDPVEMPGEYLMVERVGGSGSGIDKNVDLEVTVVAASRSRMWALTAIVETAMYALAAAGTPYVDDVAEVFAFAAQPTPSGAVAARKSSAVYTLTVRPQA